jgi:hypothetical protein
MSGVEKRGKFRTILRAARIFMHVNSNRSHFMT